MSRTEKRADRRPREPETKRLERRQLVGDLTRKSNTVMKILAQGDNQVICTNNFTQKQKINYSKQSRQSNELTRH